MRILNRFRCFGFALWMTVGVFSITHLQAASVLNQTSVHDLYSDGEFEKVDGAITDFLKQNTTYTRSDSLFIEKHLSVIYAANPATREKGKYHMYRLLALDGNAKLVDMIISDEIDKIFTKVKEEFGTRLSVNSKPTTTQQTLPPKDSADGAAQVTASNPKSEMRKPLPLPEKNTPSQSESAWKWWAVSGGVGLFAVGAVAYFALSEPSTKTAPDQTVFIPAH